MLVLLTGLSAPREGELLELEGFLNGRTSTEFHHEYRANIRFVLPPGTQGRIDRIEPFPESGNYGLLITVTSGPREGQRAWIHYDPRRPYVALCEDEESRGCTPAREPARARRAVARDAVPAIAAPADAGFVSAGLVSPRARSGAPDPDAAAAAAMENEVGVSMATDAMEEVRRTVSPRISCGAGGASALPPGRSCYQPSRASLLALSLKPDFWRMSKSARVKPFIDYIAYWAIQAQEETRIPASVVIAQAIIETGSGGSDLYRYNNELFGISCTERGAPVSYAFTHEGQRHFFRGECLIPRPPNEGGYYVAFSDPRQSVLAHAHTLLTGAAFRDIQRVIARTPESGVVDWRAVVGGMGRYAKDGNYRSLLASVIESERLDRFDRQVNCGH